MPKNNPKILVVEDEPDVCNSLQSYFGRRGFLVSTTPSGQEALSIIETSKPDIVLLDLKLAEAADIKGNQSHCYYRPVLERRGNRGDSFSGRK